MTERNGKLQKDIDTLKKGEVPAGHKKFTLTKVPDSLLWKWPSDSVHELKVTAGSTLADSKNIFAFLQ